MGSLCMDSLPPPAPSRSGAILKALAKQQRSTPPKPILQATNAKLMSATCQHSTDFLLVVFQPKSPADNMCINGIHNGLVVRWLQHKVFIHLFYFCDNLHYEHVPVCLMGASHAHLDAVDCLNMSILVGPNPWHSVISYSPFATQYQIARQNWQALINGTLGSDYSWP